MASHRPILVGMTLRTGPARVLVAHAPETAFVNRTKSILGRLGYAIYDPKEFAALGSSDLPPGSPHLFIADERRLEDVSDTHEDAEKPIIMLTGRRGTDADDDRIVAAVRRPAGLHDLYCILQRIFEQTPRTTPRIPVTLGATCGQRERRWEAEMVSLSENGALLRSAETVSLGSIFDLAFELSEGQRVVLRAEAAYQLMPDLGIVFSGVDPAVREQIAAYVQDEILAV